MIDEIMLAFDSPGNVSIVLIYCSPVQRSKLNEPADTTTTTEMSLAVFLRFVVCAPNWLAAESVLAQCRPARSVDPYAKSMPIETAIQISQEKLLAPHGEYPLPISPPSIRQL